MTPLHGGQRGEVAALAHAHVDQALRQALHDAAQLAERLAGLDHQRQHRQRRDQAVAGGAVLEEDDVARTARRRADSRRAPSPRPRSDRRPGRATRSMPCSRSARSRPRLLITVATTPPLGRRPLAVQLDAEHRQHLVAVDHLAALVDEDDAIGVAVERHADVRAARRARAPRASCGCSAPQSRLMFSPSGSTPMAITSAPSSASTSGPTR